MEFDNWIPVSHLNPEEFYIYLQTLSEDERAVDLQNYS